MAGNGGGEAGDKENGMAGNGGGEVGDEEDGMGGDDSEEEGDKDLEEDDGNGPMEVAGGRPDPGASVEVLTSAKGWVSGTVVEWIGRKSVHVQYEGTKKTKF